jgi:hypothetical protein
MKPGLYKNLSDTEYFAIDAFSRSFGKDLKRSPMHAKYWKENPKEPTENLKFGTFLHVGIITPSELKNKYYRSVKLDKRKGDDKAIDKYLDKQNEGKLEAKPKWFSALQGIIFRLKEHPSARKLLSGVDMREATAVWENKKTGVLCKARADLINTELETIIDLKSCNDARSMPFGKDIVNYSYDLQATAYLEGFKAAGVNVRRFVLIAIEKDPPYAVAVYEVPIEVIIACQNEWHEYLKTYSECKANNRWPGYSDGVQFAEIPNWRLYELGIEG